LFGDCSICATNALVIGSINVFLIKDGITRRKRHPVTDLSPSSGVEEDLGVHEERNSGVVCGDLICQTKQPGGKLWSIASWCQFVPVAKPDFNCSDSCIGGEFYLEKGRARPRRRV